MLESSSLQLIVLLHILWWHECRFDASTVDREQIQVHTHLSLEPFLRACVHNLHVVICEWGSFVTSLYFSFICIRVERLEVRFLLNYKLIILTVFLMRFSVCYYWPAINQEWNVKIACTKIKLYGDKYSLAFSPNLFFPSKEN